MNVTDVSDPVGGTDPVPVQPVQVQVVPSSVIGLEIFKVINWPEL